MDCGIKIIWKKMRQKIRGFMVPFLHLPFLPLVQHFPDVWGGEGKALLPYCGPCALVLKKTPC